MSKFNLDLFDALTNEAVFEKDYKPTDKEYQNMLKFDFEKEPQTLMQMSLGDLEENINKDGLDHLFFTIQDKELEGVITDKKVMWDPTLRRALEEVTGKRYFRLDRDYIQDALFFSAIRNDPVAKGVLTSDKINAIFKINHDIFLDDLHAGAAFVTNLGRKLRELSDTLGTDDWDRVDNNTLLKGLGVEMDNFMQALDNPIKPHDYPEYDNKDKVDKSHALSAFNKLKTDLEKGKEEDFVKDKAEIVKGNLELKTEEGDKGGSK